jgi:hypothetical protein
MGAVFADAGLQAGLSYRSVVAPRVQRLLVHWPTATTTTAFSAKAGRFGLEDVLHWRHPHKLRRIFALADFFGQQGVDTIADARAWLASDDVDQQLLALPGVGPKTASYLRVLVGLPEIAVDRHIRSFAEAAGVHGHDQDLQAWLREAASASGMSPCQADWLVWEHRSRQSGRLSVPVQLLKDALITEAGRSAAVD